MTDFHHSFQPWNFEDWLLMMIVYSDRLLMLRNESMCCRGRNIVIWSIYNGCTRCCNGSVVRKSFDVLGRSMRQKAGGEGSYVFRREQTASIRRGGLTLV